MELISLVAGGSVAATAFMEGKRGGLVGIVIGLLIGVSVGFGVFWATRKAIKWTVMRHGLHQPQLSPSRLALAWGLLFGTAIWMVLACVAVTLLMRLIVRHL